MGNFRGNTYSKGHISLKPTDDAHWYFRFVFSVNGDGDVFFSTPHFNSTIFFSWYEMARYDLPAMINYVLHFTSEDNLYYVDHSEGTITMFAKLATERHFSRKVTI